MTYDMIPDSHFVYSLLEASPDMFFVYDLPMKAYRFASHGVTEILGYQVDDVLTMQFNFMEQLLHPDNKSKPGDGLKWLTHWNK
ncbi:MAG: hypothetical protein KBA26_07740 [Candidatus Delongbacteria bacterium]|nr:hypothetical protein [Candidatus Delongbacteria bacterium]